LKVQLKLFEGSANEDEFCQWAKLFKHDFVDFSSNDNDKK